MPEPRRESRRVFGEPLRRKGSGVIRTEGDNALPPEVRDELNQSALESYMAERRARIALKNRS